MNFPRPIRLALLLITMLVTSGALRAQQVYYVDRATDNGDFLTGEGTNSNGYYGDFRYCWIMSQLYRNPFARTSTIIVLRSDVTLTRPLPPWTPDVPQDLTIKSDNSVYQINGGGEVRLLFFDAPGSTFNLQDLFLINGHAKGGEGRSRGGGGAGLGGAIFVNAGSLSLSGVYFSNNKATGGNSLPASYRSFGGGGGGGSQWGFGGADPGGGGGFFGAGGTGGDGSGGGGGLATSGASGYRDAGGGGGGLTPAGLGDTRNPGQNGGTGGDAAGRTADSYRFNSGLNAVGRGGGGGGAGGIAGGIFTISANGGDGQIYGGGGGSGYHGVPPTRGGHGGDFGGGGCGGPGSPGGNGGFGGGGGAGEPCGRGGFGAGNGGSTYEEIGGGGSAYGGSIFLRTGASLLVRDASISAGTLTAGAPGGSAAGDGIYVMSGANLTYELNGTSYSSVTGGIAGEGGFFLSGPASATVELGGVNTYSGVTIVQYGTLRLGSTGRFSPDSIFNIYDYGTVDLNGRDQTFTSARFTGSTGTVTNGRANTPLTVTLDAADNAGPPLNVSFRNGASSIALRKTGAGTLRLGGRSTATGGTTVAAGTLELAGELNGAGTIVGDLTVLGAGRVNTVAPSALGWAAGAKIDRVTLKDGGSLNNTVNADQSWAVAFTLDNGGILSSNGGVSSATTASKYTFGSLWDSRVSVRATGAARSEIRGRVDLKPQYGQTLVDFTVDAGSSLLASAAITSDEGAVGLRKLGAGSLLLTAANPYSGGTFVDAGTLELEGSSTNGEGVIRGALTVQPGATLVTRSANSLGTASNVSVSSITLNGNSTLRNLAGEQGWGVAYNLNGGRLVSNDGAAGASATSLFSFGGPSGRPTSVTVGASSSIEGRVDLRPDNGNAATEIQVAAGSTLSVPAALTGSGGLLKTGAGALLLRAANTYSGSTSINAGSLVIAAGGNLSSSSAISIASGATLDGSAASGLTLGPISGPGSLVLGASATLSTPSGATTGFSGVLSGNGTLTKTGSGTLTLSGNNTYGGAISVEGGTLTLASTGALSPSTSLAIATGATFDVSAKFDATFGPLSGTGSLVLGANSFTADQAADTTFSGVISGLGRFIKAGSGTLVLTGRNTFAGTVFANGGVLVFSSSQSIGSSSIFQFGGGTLRWAPGNTYDLSQRFIRFNATSTLDVGANNVVFANPIGTHQNGTIGTGGLIKAGTGVLTLSGANTYAGGTLVSAGTLRLAPGATLGTGRSLTVAAGATLDLSAFGAAGYTLPAGSTVTNLGTITGILKIAGASPALAVEHPADTAAASGAAVAFGPRPLGAPVFARTVLVRNRGAGPLNISSLTVGGATPADFALDRSALPSVLAPGATAPVVIRFAPSVLGARSATLTLASDDSTTPVFTLALSGGGGTPRLSVLSSADTPLPRGSTVNAWGLNTSRQSPAPAGLSGIIAIAAGGYHSLGLKADGTVTAWGENSSGQSNAPAGLSGVVAISGGDSHSLALKSDGALVAWGKNDYGQINVPANLPALVAISAGGFHNLALRSDGLVAAWGIDTAGQSTVPAGLSNVVAIAAGGYHSLALKADGTVVAWGRNQEGQSTVPAGLSGVVAISAGVFHSLAFKADGSVVAWGSNAENQKSVPVGLSGVVAVSAGGYHNLALKSDGTVSAWGRDNFDQSTIPSGLSGVAAISAGYFHNLSLFAPPPMDLGRGEIGSAGTPVAFTVRNSGNAPLSLQSVTLAGAHPADFLLDARALGSSLAPGASATITLAFRAQAAGSRQAVLRIRGDDPANPVLEFSFVATGFTAPHLVVESPADTSLTAGAALDFGALAPGASGPGRSVVLRNRGGAALTVSGLSRGGSHAADFVLDTPSLPAVIAPDATLAFTLRFVPTASGARSASLTITSDDPDIPAFALTLSGTGLSPLQSWRLLHFSRSDGLGQSADSADPDGDGAPNLLEYAFGLDPLDPASARPPAIVLSGAGPEPALVCEFTSPDGVGDVGYGAEWSPSLAPDDWTAVPDTGSGSRHVFRLPLAGRSRAFLRLVVTPAP